MTQRQTTALPFDWLEEISASVVAMDDTPLIGGPPFPWDEFSHHLGDLLGRSDLRITSAGFSWCEGSRLLEGVGASPRWISATVSPLEGPIYLLMGDDDVQQLAHQVLLADSAADFTLDGDFIEGFHRFFALAVIHLLGRLGLPSELQVRLNEGRPNPEEPALCADIMMTIGERRLQGRLVLSNALRKSWRHHFRSLMPPARLDAGKEVEVPLHIRAGGVKLSQKEWDKLALGDCIVLDRCTVDPETGTGHVLLLLRDLPIFEGKLTNHTIQLTELTHQKDAMIMGKDGELDDEDDFDDGEEDEEFSFNEDYFDEDEEETAADEFEEDEDDDSDDDDDDYDDDDDDDDEEAVAEETLAASKKKTPAAAVQTVKTAKEPLQKLNLKEMTLKLSVEIAKVRMSVDKLIALQPGNILELGVNQEDGVYLTHKGKRVARGELVRIGEALGLRILEL